MRVRLLEDLDRRMSPAVVKAYAAGGVYTLPRREAEKLVQAKKAEPAETETQEDQ